MGQSRESRALSEEATRAAAAFKRLLIAVRTKDPEVDDHWADFAAAMSTKNLRRRTRRGSS